LRREWKKKAQTVSGAFCTLKNGQGGSEFSYC
jgi:hypothetical protein